MDEQIWANCDSCSSLLENDILRQGKKLRLWANARKEAAMNEGKKEKDLPTRKLICWKSATVILNGKHVVALRRADPTMTATTATTKNQQMIRLHDGWHDSRLHNQSGSWVHSEVTMRLEGLELSLGGGLARGRRRRRQPRPPRPERQRRLPRPSQPP